MARELLSHTLDEVQAIAKAAMPTGHGVARELYLRAIEEGVFRPEDTGITARAAETWRSLFSLELPEVVRTTDEDDPEGRSTIKAVLRAKDGLEYECVRIPMGEERSTLCLSSQVGCKMGCTFCETGRMGLLRNLSPGEIVGQLVVARAVLGWRVDKIVFMGMGEALDNFEALDQALRVLNDRKGIQLGMQRITICTVGHAEGLEKLGSRGYKRLGLSVSLNAASDALRSSMMPINRKVPLGRLKEVMQAYPRRKSFVWAVNYCLLPGVNDRAEDIEDVARFFDGLGRAVLNLIPYNPGSKPITRAPTEEEIWSFTSALQDRGVMITRRVTRGRSVMAACGQLGNVELRRRAKTAPDTPEPTP